MKRNSITTSKTNGCGSGAGALGGVPNGTPSSSTGGKGASKGLKQSAQTFSTITTEKQLYSESKRDLLSAKQKCMRSPEEEHE